MRRRDSHAARHRALLFMLLLLMFVGAAIQGDTVHLVNGDRISGVVQGAAEGTLTLATEYAGEIQIDLAEVTAVVTDEALAVRLEDGAIQEGRLAAEDGVQVLQRGDSAEPLSLDTVDAVARDAEALKKSHKKWSGTVEAATSLRSGDTDTLDASLGLKFLRSGHRDKLTIEMTGGYGEVDSQVNVRRVKGAAKWQYYLKDRLYTYAHAGSEHDPARRLDLRFETGLGAGYDAIRADRRSLSLAAGIDYAREYWNTYSLKELDDAKRDVRNATRSALKSYLRGRLGKPWTLEDGVDALELTVNALTAGVEQETVSEDNVYLRLTGEYTQKLFKASTLSETLTLLPRLDDFGEYRLTSDLAFDTPLSARLSLRINVLTEHDSETATDEDSWTNTLLAGLLYSF